MSRPALLLARAVALSSIGFGAFAIISIDGWAWAGAILTIAILWNSSSFVVDVLLGGGPARDATDKPGTRITMVIRLGAERADVARMTIAMAAQHGPTVVVTAGRADLGDLIDPDDVSVYVGTTIEESLRDASHHIDTDAVLITSAGAIPIRSTAESAAAAIGDQIGWVTGRSLVLGADGYAPDDRELFGSRLRASARAGGLVAWESDATLVSTHLLREHPIDSEHPWGRWLRHVAKLGYRGVESSHILSVRAAPIDADAFWPSTVARQRASATDLADATQEGSLRARLLALGLLLRELHAVPLCIWLLSPLLVASSGSFPFDHDPVMFLGLAATLASARWLTGRWIHRANLTPRHDALNIAYTAPGSLLALPAMLNTRRKGPRPIVSHRVLVWAALLLTAAVAVPLINGHTGTTSSRVAAALALVDLVVLWMLGMRAAVQSKWKRSAWRIPIDIPATIGGQQARTTNGSLSGIAVSGCLPTSEIGASVEVQLDLDDGSSIDADAVVVDHRDAEGNVVMGLSFSLPRQSRRRWTHQLLTPVVQTASMPGALPQTIGKAISGPPRKRHRLPTLLDWLATSSLAAISAVAIGALVLILLGYRPLVVRSASMAPTIPVGSTVIVDQVAAIDLRPGDVVTFDNPEEGVETITHRISEIAEHGGRLHFRTRGDANLVSEFWSVPSDARVDKQVFTVPIVGTMLSRLNGHPRIAFLGLVAALVAFSVLEAIAERHRDTARPPPASSDERGHRLDM